VVRAVVVVANREEGNEVLLGESEMLTLHSKAKEMVAIAASVAGNCLPCLKYHFTEAVKIGCIRQEIQEIIEISNMLEQNPIK